MGECGNHAENLRSLNEMPMDLLRLSLGQTTWVYFVCIRHGYSPCNVQNPHEGYLRPEWPKIPKRCHHLSMFGLKLNSHPSMELTVKYSNSE